MRKKTLEYVYSRKKNWNTFEYFNPLFNYVFDSLENLFSVNITNSMSQKMLNEITLVTNDRKLNKMFLLVQRSCSPFYISSFSKT